jgi:hypothetical protein
MEKLSNEKFEELENEIHETILKLDRLQGYYVRQTGKPYVIGGPREVDLWAKLSKNFGSQSK